MLNAGVNSIYWQFRSGKACAEQQKYRSEHTNTSCGAQESWLLGYVRRLHEERGGERIRVLDFGCGFGRIARLLCPLDFIDYHGYDFSPAMVEELKNAPPKAIASDFDSHVRIGADLASAFAKEPRFDLILTISVMIHNRPDWVRDTIGLMLEYLAPNGRVALVENRHTAVSAIENFWHGGCWCHCFPRYFDGKADLEILDHLAGQHGVYLATPHQTPRESQYLYYETPEADGVLVDYEGILSLGLDRAAVNADTLTTELYAHHHDQVDLTGRFHDVCEARDIAVGKLAHLETRYAEADARITQLLQEHESTSQQLALALDANARLEGRLSEARSEKALAQARFADRQNLVKDLGTSLAALRKMRPAPIARQDEAQGGHQPRANIILNDRQDTIYSNDLPEMKQVLHVFHQEWTGIRAAAGSLDGQKLAITAERDMSRDDVMSAYQLIADGNFARIVFHGFSENAFKIIAMLRQRGLGDILYLVKHGSPEQWVYKAERDMSYRAIELLKSGSVKKLHVMKPGFYYPANGLFRPILFNMAPNLTKAFPMQAAEASELRSVAFSAGWSDWRKNVHTNLMGAALSQNIDAVWHHATDVELPGPLNAKLVHKKFATREETFHLMALASISLNVSITDCHPMVNIESQAFGRPCLRGNLHLDALEDHPYVGLTRVEDPSSIVAITATIDRLLSIPVGERREMTKDYQRQNDRVSRARYREFLEI